MDLKISSTEENGSGLFKESFTNGCNTTFMRVLALHDFSKEILTIQNLTKTVLLDGLKYFASFRCDTFQIDFLMLKYIYIEDQQFAIYPLDHRKKYW